MAGRTGGQSTFSTVAAGGLIGVLELVIAVSFGTLLFGRFGDHASTGIALSLGGGIVFLLVVSWRGSLPGATASVQDAPMAVLAPVTAAVAFELGPGREGFHTAVAVVLLASAACGLVFSALGVARLGRLVRYVPHPVMAGFLGGTGWLLAVGAVDVMAGVTVGASTAGELVTPEVAVRWVPGLAMAVALLGATRRWSGPAIVPGTFVAVAVLVYGVAVVAGAGSSGLEAGGWLVGPFAEAAGWRPRIGTVLAGADWAEVVTHAGDVAAIPLVAVMAALLNANGAELVLDGDADADRDLRAAGLANVVAAMAAAPPGYHALSLSSIAKRVGAPNRLSGLVAGGVVAVALVAGMATFGRLPRLALGGLLLFLGLSLLIEWAHVARRALPGAEQLLVLAIVVAIATFGFLAGIMLGLAASVVVFAVRNSRIDVVKHEFTGRSYRSKVDRSGEHWAAIVDAADSVLVLELHGYLFFGTAAGLVDRVRRRLGAASGPPLRFVLLDLRRVLAVDPSAEVAVARIAQLLRQHDAALVVSGFDRQLPGVDHAFPSLDDAMSWCEGELLVARGVDPNPAAVDVAGWLAAELGSARLAAAIMTELRPVDVVVGATLIEQGGASTALYFVESAVVRTSRWDGRGPTHLRTSGPGTLIGEVGFYGGTRTASVEVVRSGRVWRLEPAGADRIEACAPDAALALHRFVVRRLAVRLAQTTEAVSALLD